MSSARPLAELILRSLRIYAVEPYYVFNSENYGGIILELDSDVYELTVEEIGKEGGQFEASIVINKVDGRGFDKSNSIVIDGPFGLVEVSQVFFQDQFSMSVKNRIDALKLTFDDGEAVVEVDLNAVGTFRIKVNRAGSAGGVGL